jgi:hypothetical protein
MGQRCRVCSHKHVDLINLALARGVSVLAVSRKRGVSVDSLYRHVRNGHLPPQLRASLVAGPVATEADLDKLKEDEGASWLATMLAHRQHLFNARDIAEEHGDVNMLVRVSAEIHRSMELVAKFLGTLVQRHEVTRTNILISADYLQLRSVLVRALQPYPEAARAVAAALHTLEHQAAEAMTKPAPKVIEHQAEPA